MRVSKSTGASAQRPKSPRLEPTTRFTPYSTPPHKTSEQKQPEAKREDSKPGVTELRQNPAAPAAPWRQHGNGVTGKLRPRTNLRSKTFSPPIASSNSHTTSNTMRSNGPHFLYPHRRDCLSTAILTASTECRIHCHTCNSLFSGQTFLHRAPITRPRLSSATAIVKQHLHKMPHNLL